MGIPLRRARAAPSVGTEDMVYTQYWRQGLQIWAESGPFTKDVTQEDCVMPWKESRVVDQRLQFLSSYQKEEMSLTDLCHEYGISRPTAYKWIKRYNEVGPEGLLDLSRSLPCASLEFLNASELITEHRSPEPEFLAFRGSRWNGNGWG